MWARRPAAAVAGRRSWLVPPVGAVIAVVVVVAVAVEIVVVLVGVVVDNMAVVVVVELAGVAVVVDIELGVVALVRNAPSHRAGSPAHNRRLAWSRRDRSYM